MLDASIQFWLQSQDVEGHTRIIPHVRSAAPRKLHYDIGLLRKSASGVSRVRQSGAIELAAGEDTAITNLVTSLQPTDKCTLSVRLEESGTLVGTYELDCRPSD